MVAVCKLNNEEVIFWLVCFGCFFFNESQYWKSGKSLQRTPLREDTGTLNRDCMSEVLFLPFISLSYLSSKNDGDNWWQKKPQSNKNTLNPVTWEALWVRFLNFFFFFLNYCHGLLLVSLLSPASICSVYLLLPVLCWVVPFFVHYTVYPHCFILSWTCLQYDFSAWLPSFSALSAIPAGCLALPLLKFLLRIIVSRHSSFLSQQHSIAEGTYQNSRTLKAFQRCYSPTQYVCISIGYDGFLVNHSHYVITMKLRQNAGQIVGLFTLWSPWMQCKRSSCCHLQMVTRTKKQTQQNYCN